MAQSRAVHRPETAQQTHSCELGNGVAAVCPRCWGARRGSSHRAGARGASGRPAPGSREGGTGSAAGLIARGR